MKYYLYVMGGLDSPILKSQVVNWLEILQKHGITFNILTCPSLFYLLKYGKRQKKVINEFRKKLRGRIYQLVTLRTLDDFDILSSFLKALAILILIRKERKRNPLSEIIIQTRSGSNYRSFKIVKKIFSEVKIVLDFRGASPEEYLNSISMDNAATIDDPIIRKKYLKLVDQEITMIQLADLVLCVSNSLKKYVLSKGGSRIDSRKMVVVPGAADKDVFYFDRGLRINCRKELIIENKRVLIYTGRLKNNYHKKEQIFEFASKYIDLDDANYFICLSPDIETAFELKLKYDIPNDKILIKSSDGPSEINLYLNASDIGIILRENVPTNKVSSPTKLAEYLLAGLPVIVSEQIGDYSEFIKNNNLGIVVNNQIEDMIELVKKLDLSVYHREANSVFTTSLLSKQANVERIVNSLNRMI